MDDMTYLSRQEFTRFFDLVPDLMCVVNTDGVLLLVNNAWEACLGYPVEEIAGHSVQDFLHPDDVIPTLHEISVRRIHDDRDTYINRLQTRDNSFRTIEWRSVLTEDGVLYAVGRDITSMKETERKLQRMVEENQLLMRELQHRVKNNLSLVSSMLHLSALNESDTHLQEVFKESRYRIKAIAELYDLLYRSDRIDSIDLSGYISEVAQSAFEVFNHTDSIRLQIDAVTCRIISHKAVPLGLIVNELITNAMKYAFPSAGPGGHGRKGSIRVSLQQEYHGSSTWGVLQVCDNGIGLQTVKTPEGMGTLLLKSFIKQIGGELSVISDGGTEVTVRFPCLPE
ncbi:MAG: sensor histidine kinase [Spirochaeta sp.]